ncbi:hypothetical protein K461DRAFT_271468 [Myriangium duriaei CBS 260.36]|uniref:2EXR domain-containing protein n=1 Tax=Myriangium duriaei CBS 260.36 TaxID=1168546 RepID=A0A9P4MD63_9PEZI|nr:hypothetical protein K461DRAFT_271468 [Myriangium duriaei CBS 260.36]
MESEMASSSTSFPLFSKLPSELRIQIWRESLPDPVGQCLFKYDAQDSHMFWKTRPISQELDGDLYGGHTAAAVVLEFCHENLRKHEFELPTAYVNHEARAVTLNWARDHGLSIQPEEEKTVFDLKTMDPYYIRSFDPESDILYIDCEDWGDFLYGLQEADFTFGNNLVGFSALVTFIAFGLDSLVQHEFKPDISPDEDIIFKWRLEADPSTPAGMFTWVKERDWKYRSKPLCDAPQNDQNDHLFREVDVAQYGGPDIDGDHNPTLFRLIVDLNNELATFLPRADFKAFAVRPIYANWKPNGLVSPWLFLKNMVRRSELAASDSDASLSS